MKDKTRSGYLKKTITFLSVGAAALLGAITLIACVSLFLPCVLIGLCLFPVSYSFFVVGEHYKHKLDKYDHTHKDKVYLDTLRVVDKEEYDDNEFENISKADPKYFTIVGSSKYNSNREKQQKKALKEKDEKTL